MPTEVVKAPAEKALRSSEGPLATGRSARSIRGSRDGSSAGGESLIDARRFMERSTRRAWSAACSRSSPSIAGVAIPLSGDDAEADADAAFDEGPGRAPAGDRETTVTDPPLPRVWVAMLDCPLLPSRVKVATVLGPTPTQLLRGVAPPPRVAGWADPL